MDALAELVIAHAPNAHFMIFACLMLAGLNFPISEDMLLILSGALASAIVPENSVQLFIWAFLGAYLSDWEAYWIGRRLGPAIFETRWLKGRTNKKRLLRISQFYKRYGVWTLFFGRFIPFGVRNCLFMSAGIGRMHFGYFLLSDGLACLMSNAVFYSLGYYFGQNSSLLHEHLRTYQFSIFCVFLLVIAVLILRLSLKRWKVAEAQSAE